MLSFTKFFYAIIVIFGFTLLAIAMHTQVLFFKNKTYCKACFDINDIKKYNPFFEVLNQHDEILDSNFILENEPEESVEAIESASNTLENYSNHDISSSNKATSSYTKRWQPEKL